MALSVVGLDVTATGRAVVDAQSGLALDDQALETLSVAFTERAAGAREVPASTAAAARQDTPAPGLVEFDAAVNACISQVRSALGDSARSPRFIQTVPRSGYRCLVEQVPAVGTGETGTELISSGTRSAGTRSADTGSSVAWIRVPGSRRLAAAMTGTLVAAMGAGLAISYRLA